MKILFVQAVVIMILIVADVQGIFAAPADSVITNQMQFTNKLPQRDTIELGDTLRFKFLAASVPGAVIRYSASAEDSHDAKIFCRIDSITGDVKIFATAGSTALQPYEEFSIEAIDDAQRAAWTNIYVTALDVSTSSMQNEKKPHASEPLTNMFFDAGLLFTSEIAAGGEPLSDVALRVGANDLLFGAGYVWGTSGTVTSYSRIGVVLILPIDSSVTQLAHELSGFYFTVGKIVLKGSAGWISASAGISVYNETNRSEYDIVDSTAGGILEYIEITHAKIKTTTTTSFGVPVAVSVNWNIGWAFAAGLEIGLNISGNGVTPTGRVSLMLGKFPE